MPRLSLGLGVQSVRKIKSGGSAPSGLLVSSTASIAIVSVAVATGTYNKKTTNAYIGDVDGISYYAGTGAIYNLYPDIPPNTLIYTLLGPNATIKDGTGTEYLINASNWAIYEIYNDSGFTYAVRSSNASTDANYIPTSGWSPSVTITAV